MLGKGPFGEYGLIYATMITFSTVVSGGLNFTVTKYVAELRKSDTIRAGRIIGVCNLMALCCGVLAAGLLIGIAPPLFTFLGGPHLVPLAALSAVGVVLSVMSQVQNGVLAGLEAFRSIANRNCWNGLGRICVMVPAVYYYGLAGSVVGAVVGEGLIWLLNREAVNRECRAAGISISFGSCWNELTILWQFSLPATLTGALITPMTWVCSLILAHQPDGYQQLGLYNAAMQWLTVITFIPLALNEVALPMFSNLFGLEDMRNHRKLFLVNLTFYTVVSGGLAILVCMFSNPVMGLYGEEFTSGSVTLRLIAVASVFFIIQELMLRTLASKGEMWIAFTFRLLSGIILVGATYLFTSRQWGAAGMAGASALTYAVAVFGQGAWLRLKQHY